MRAAGRREEYDRWRVRIHGLAVFDQREIVDAAALERNRTGQARRVDVHAWRRGERGVPGHGLSRHAARLSWRLRRSRCRRSLGRAGLLRGCGRLLRPLLRLLLLDLLLLIQL